MKIPPYCRQSWFARLINWLFGKRKRDRYEF